MNIKIKKASIKMSIVIAMFLFACNSGNRPPTQIDIQRLQTTSVTTADTVQDSGEVNDNETTDVDSKIVNESITVNDDETADVVTKIVPEDSNKSVAEKFFFVEVDERPIFDKEEINIEREFLLYVHERIVYPKEAIEKRITGRVWVKFIIDTDGSIIDLNLLRFASYDENLKPIDDNAIGSLFATEVMRILKDAPKWRRPGKNNGKPVKVEYWIMYWYQLTN